MSEIQDILGDPLLTAWIGWDSGNWHTKVTGLLNVPIGSYSKHDVANMGFNHWAFDASGAWLFVSDMAGGHVSAVDVASGVTRWR